MAKIKRKAYNKAPQPIFKDVSPKDKGYAVITREWKKGDVISLSLPMDVNEVSSRETIKANEGRIALQRGPLVYCVEGADNDGQAWNFVVPDNTQYTITYNSGLLKGIVTIQANVPAVKIGADGLSINTKTKTITAIPYYSWCNRGSNPMQVWLPRKIKDIKLNY